MQELKRAVRCAGAAVFALWLFAAAAFANGWEHWGVPLDALLAALSSGQSEYQAAAARSLGFRREPSAVAPLRALVERPGTATAAAVAAVEALGNIGDASVLPLLHRLLRQDPRERVRAEAAAALGRIGAPESQAPLLQALASGPAPVRVRAAEALGGYGTGESVAALSRLLEKGAPAALRRRAIVALGSSGPRAVPPLLAQLAGTRGEGELGDVADALGRIGDARAAPALSGLLDRPRGAELRARVAVALGRLRDGQALPALLKLLDDESIAVRFFAVDSLAAANDKRAVEPLSGLERRLGRARTPGSPQLLAELNLRAAVLAALTEIDAPGSVENFLAAARAREFPRDNALGLQLNDAQYELRRAAVVGLGYSRMDAATTALISPDVLGDPDFRLRAAAVRALGVSGAREALAPLLARLEDRESEVRWEAAFVLGRIGRREAMGALSARLDDFHPEVRRQAALSLGQLGAGGARLALETLARDDPDADVQSAARAALAMLGVSP